MSVADTGRASLEFGVQNVNTVYRIQAVYGRRDTRRPHGTLVTALKIFSCGTAHATPLAKRNLSYMFESQLLTGEEFVR